MCDSGEFNARHIVFAIAGFISLANVVVFLLLLIVFVSLENVTDLLLLNFVLVLVTVVDELLQEDDFLQRNMDNLNLLERLEGNSLEDRFFFRTVADITRLERFEGSSGGGNAVVVLDVIPC